MRTARRRAQSRFHQLGCGTKYFRTFGADPRSPVARLFRTLPDLLHRRGFALKFCLARIGERIGSFPGRLVRGYEPLVFKLLQRGIDCTGAGFVDAARLSLQLLHQFVAVFGAALQHRKQGEPNFARTEETAPASSSTPRESSTHEWRCHRPAPPTSTSSVHTELLFRIVLR